MRQFLLIMLSCIALSTQAQIGMKSGLLLNGGSGSINAKLNPLPENRQLAYAVFDNKAHFSIGYRFRLMPLGSSFFYDIDLNVGARLWEYVCCTRPVNSEEDSWLIDNASCVYSYGSLAGTVGYNVYKKLSLGIGIEPRYYFYKSGEETNKPAFDVPLVGRVAYDFGFAAVSVSYKYGFIDTLQSDLIKSVRFNDWQISLFIPF